ncbi:MAG: AbrB/MazE/SpoVT family DNA-binding domain-containing protein [Chloroflexi bacterium]|nr:AbrB/MazE/SpoVT family DNA-binding domain-containing protein [Chloroflexota bacterium]
MRLGQRYLTAMHTRIDGHGRITIPEPIRRQLGIVPNTLITVEVVEESRRIVLTPITRARIHRLRGKYKDRGLLKAWMQARDGDRKKERV